jgi:hypothetical protein
MSPRTIFILINVVGGIAVLASYVIGIVKEPVLRGQLWGNVPGSLRPVYTAFMFLAAAGYFAFTTYILRHVATGDVRLFGRFGMEMAIWLYLLILIPSALWMQLTFSMLENPSNAQWLMVRLDLFAVGSASLALLIGLLTATGEPGSTHYWLAVTGTAAFTVQTLLLDALIWPAYFPH